MKRAWIVIFFSCTVFAQQQQQQQPPNQHAVPLGKALYSIGPSVSGSSIEPGRFVVTEELGEFEGLKDSNQSGEPDSDDDYTIEIPFERVPPH